MDQNNEFGLFNTTLLSSSNFKSKLSIKYSDLKYDKSDNLDLKEASGEFVSSTKKLNNIEIFSENVQNRWKILKSLNTKTLTTLWQKA